MIIRDDEKMIAKRNKLARKVFVKGSKNKLRSLIDLLNQDPDVQRLVLCGSRVDYNYCLGSNKLCLGIVALPGGYRPGRMPAYHPHQTEIKVPIYGKLYLETYTPKQGIKKLILQQGQKEYFATQKNVCHRIVAPKGGYKNEAFIDVKTQVGKEPRVIGVRDEKNPAAGCATCRYHGQNPQECPILQSYLKELKNEKRRGRDYQSKK